jgi:uncharacterized membrane protein
MADATNFATTRQGVHDLNRPTRSGGAGVNVGPAERALSSVGGAVLAGLGVGRGGLAGWTLAALGGAMIARGSTGHCSLYAATGINTAR